ncbi:MAG: hypothetical protein KDC57_11110, partial [Saprospiraceae bacterium]|nr:hypothetical protein [Saprospiraceae bacterium]
LEDVMTKAQKDKFFDHYFSRSNHRDVPLKRQEYILAGSGLSRAVAFTKNAAIQLFRYNQHTFSPEDKRILIRFAQAFEQAYTRFLDLQKAETQAREAEIQLALERIRARSMAMQNSSELLDAASLLFEQTASLGCNPFSCGFVLLDRNKADGEFFMSADGQFQPSVFIPNHDESAERNMYLHWLDGSTLYTEDGEGDALVKHFEYLMSLPGETGEMFRAMHAAGIRFPTWQRWHAAYFKYGYLLFITREPFAETEIFVRFATAFEQTYTRFLDLQKAEAQAREAEIQLGLERVRARAMAMQSSEELSALIGTVFTELTKLDLVLTRCIILIFDPDTKGSMWWMANSEDPDRPSGYFVKYHKAHPYLAYLKAWKAKSTNWLYVLEGKEKIDWDEEIFTQTELSNLPDFVIEGMKAPERVFLTASFNQFGCLNVASLEPLNEEQTEILERFASAFNLTYTRFNDLQQAEAQAREAEIQLALERVRARTMAMHNSQELGEVAMVLFEQVSLLDNTPDRFNIRIINEAEQAYEFWATDQNGQLVDQFFKAKFDQSPVVMEMYNAWKKKEKLLIQDIHGDALTAWVHFIKDVLGVPFNLDHLKEHRFLTSVFFSHGNIGITTNSVPNPNSIQLLERFAKVFEQTYTRFLDLKKAEAQTREAIRQASLDRIRGEIASMRTSEDLNRITPLIWRELQALEVPFIRCGVFIIDQETNNVEAYLTSPEGKALAVLHFTPDANTLTSETVRHWLKKQMYKAHWNQQDFIDWTRSMIETGQVQNAETYQGASAPPESLDLHFLPFRQGMLYVGDVAPLTDEKLDLVKTLAEAFSIAYARYEDFRNLESAKQEVEHTLDELKQTQQQLIQSEKMASLGELTAGIAHEIQNPLNFVNNFSEVNRELLNELLEAFDNSDLEEARTLIADLLDNEDKVTHHGRRAEAIVKSMLQHSRLSSGEKELTDINALCDEYLRLAYHGFRAKDKSFNADFITEFDPKLPQIQVIPQDIGRVLLNLINNAFQAVAGVKNPKVNVYTRNSPSADTRPDDLVGRAGKGSVEITITDNGPGIPAHIRDKIFQPFFTTKPTGQGTGLGLSLAYDIVKAHGGEIKVESQEGRGSVFMIHLNVH